MRTQTDAGVFRFSRDGVQLEILSDSLFRDKILYYDRLLAGIGFPDLPAGDEPLSRLLLFMLNDLLGEDAVLRLSGGRVPGPLQAGELLTALLRAYGDWLEERILSASLEGGDVRCLTSF